MSMHLEVRAGPYRLLIPALAVMEVWASAEVVVPGAWRGRVLPYVDLRQVLGQEARAGCPMLIAYGESPEDPMAAILGLDEVAGMIALEPASLKPFPPGLADAHGLFDAIAMLPGEPPGPLRLRLGVDLSKVAGSSTWLG
ncbi:MAG: hypothetical protein HYR63_28440 [Proteobacteria bacterium]|nr:hypothetical protein [Pseudomonadota bacterium]MBI3499834.1 hypothetical protein [Pseudomonadota bacterium]